MTPEQVLALPPSVLSQGQREAYFEDGFLLLEKAALDMWIEKLRAATDELVEASRRKTKSDAVFDLEPDHSVHSPRLRHVSSPIGKMSTQYDEHGRWIGCLRENDVAKIDIDKARYMVGLAGSLTLHNCRTLHGSPVNTSDRGRPLLLYVMSSGDAFPYTANPIPSQKYDGAMIRGDRPRRAHIDPTTCEIPPDWSHGYTSIFELQQQEGAAASAAVAM